MQWLKGLIDAFFTDAHKQALKNLAAKGAADGKVAIADVEAEIEKVKADLQGRQASYWNSGLVALGAFAAGVYAGHRLWP